LFALTLDGTVHRIVRLEGDLDRRDGSSSVRPAVRVGGTRVPVGEARVSDDMEVSGENGMIPKARGIGSAKRIADGWSAAQGGQT